MTVNVAAIRAKTGLSQRAFSSLYGLPLATLQNWEQHRYTPDATHRAFFRAIAREPETMARLCAPEAATS
jgi:putative transcriptional regulator